MKKEILVIISFLIVVFALSVYILGKREEKIMSSSFTSLYSYNINDTVEPKFLDVLEKYEIKRLYQEFTFDENNDFKENKLLENMFSKEIDVFHLIKSDFSLENIKDQIDLVNEFNIKHIYKLKGIVLYLELDIEKNHLEDYVNIIKSSYKYAKKYDLEVTLTLPCYLENYSQSNLDEIIEDYSDEICIINKDKNTIKNIEKELELSKKYEKKISIIYEMKNYKSYKSVYKNFMNAKKELGYSNLSISFYDYTSIIENNDLFM